LVVNVLLVYLKLTMKSYFYLLFILVFLFCAEKSKGQKIDSTQWYWNHQLGLNHYYKSIYSDYSSNYYTYPGINFISNWQQIKESGNYLCLGVNFKSFRFKEEFSDYFQFNSLTAVFDTIGKSRNIHINSHYYFNFGIGHQFQINSKWKFSIELNGYLGGMEREKLKREIIFNSTLVNVINTTSSSQNIDFISGFSTGIELFRKIGHRSSLTLSFKYDVAAVWWEKFFEPGFYNVNFGISTLLLPDQNGFPYSKKLKKSREFSDSVNSNKLKNQVYFEFLGAGLFYSINYERKILNTLKNDLNVRVGFSYFDSETYIITGVNYVFGKNRNCLEVGLNYTIGYYNYGGNNFGFDQILVPNIGLRKRNLKPFEMRAGFNPLIFVLDNDVIPSFYVSFGWKFDRNQ
jgi:hypothetical protein